MMLVRILKKLLPLLALASCTTVPVPPLDYRSGAVVETLSSEVSVSIRTAGRSVSVNGYLVYRRPDLLHLVLLTPFGSTMLEAFARGDLITLIYPASSVAYVGQSDDLSDKSGLQGWGMMRWVMDADPHERGKWNGVVERTSKLGPPEKVLFENGLVVSKVTPAGDRVNYRKYVALNGVPVAEEIELLKAGDDVVLITLSEPEVNQTLGDDVFSPRLDGVAVLPLSAVQGL